MYAVYLTPRRHGLHRQLSAYRLSPLPVAPNTSAEPTASTRPRNRHDSPIQHRFRCAILRVFLRFVTRFGGNFSSVRLSAANTSERAWQFSRKLDYCVCAPWLVLKRIASEPDTPDFLDTRYRTASTGTLSSPYRTGRRQLMGIVNQVRPAPSPALFSLAVKNSEPR